jgi:hypothetical protein
MNRRSQTVAYNDFIRSLSRGKYQQREREAITQELVSRLIIFMLNSRCLFISNLEH